MGPVAALMLAKKVYYYENDNEERQCERTTTVGQTAEAKERDNHNVVVAKIVMASSLAVSAKNTDITKEVVYTCTKHSYSL